MNRVLVTYAGRTPGLNFCKSLRLAEEEFFILGIDTNKYSILWAEADEKLLVPECESEEYIDLINKLVEKYNIDFIYSSKSNKELLIFSENREKLKAKVFFPEKEEVRLFEDKWRTYEVLKEKNIVKLPESFLIHNKEDLKEKFEYLSDNGKKEVWIRRVYGSGGAGSISTSDYRLAECWIDRFNGWGKFTISKKLTKRTCTWSSIWKDGELVISQGRERAYWEFADRAPSGVTGITGAQFARNDKEINDISLKIIKAISKKPNGVLGIDYTYDEEGNLNLTEIQASRLYSSTLFMATCGVNLPYALYKAAMEEKAEIKSAEIDPDLLWIKYVEIPAFLANKSEIEKIEEYSNKIIYGND